MAKASPKLDEVNTKSSTAAKAGFKIYGVNNTFTDDNKTGITFASYKNNSPKSETESETKAAAQSKNRWVEPGKFFRESMLKQATIKPTPDIKDKMPKRSFLPRLIASKLPFSSSRIPELKQIFHASKNSTMEKILQNTLKECERAPSPVDLMKPDSTVILRNAKIDMFKGSMRLAVDKWGRVEVTEPASFTVKEDNNLSLVEYELVNVVEE
ncbi:hypothetical protein NE237_006070 [Protea cynaroides]|uniref:BURP domain-containing protein n=1 Tax=Protea cynaroides TaxID=273540 RepID=A0A9Q0KLU8_9MAGN|nr:hypothetical protein NE237_006070 [Protea cynaroides]